MDARKEKKGSIPSPVHAHLSPSSAPLAPGVGRPNRELEPYPRPTESPHCALIVPSAVQPRCSLRDSRFARNDLCSDLVEIAAIHRRKGVLAIQLFQFAGRILKKE